MGKGRNIIIGIVAVFVVTTALCTSSLPKYKLKFYRTPCVGCRQNVQILHTSDKRLIAEEIRRCDSLGARFGSCDSVVIDTVR